jgi:hypothetical protein
VLRPIPDQPAGVIGFEAVGEVHSDDYRDVLRPAIDRAVGRGEVRLVYVLGEEFSGYSAGASWEDAKLGFDHHAAWVRTAVVSDVDWVRHLVAVLGWMVPGEIRPFALADRAGAIAWAAGTDQAVEEVEEDGRPGAGEAPVVPTVPVEAPPEPTTEPSPVVDPTTVMAAAPHLTHHQTLTPTAPLDPGAEVRAGYVTAQPAPRPWVPAQWAADPHGRHQHRWWDGERWTAYVADDGVTTTDPFG